MPLIRELEEDYGGLTSADLRSLVSDRKWDEFADVLGEITISLKRIRTIAQDYGKEAHEDNAGSKKTLTEEERACEILSIPCAASPEQIKTVYHCLSGLWHTDKGMTEDDSRMKEINWAYNFLKRDRHF